MQASLFGQALALFPPLIVIKKKRASVAVVFFFFPLATISIPSRFFAWCNHVLTCTQHVRLNEQIRIKRVAKKGISLISFLPERARERERERNKTRSYPMFSLVHNAIIPS
ncbi:hypothetical protein F5X96DRAFT_586692 [Biscogniauxia mediterranea]|nr:hypothetical protein F5X96DRAFT_586692 [Biscogniauxia mediterranea]